MLSSNEVFNFTNTDRYQAAMQRGITFGATCFVYQSCSQLPNNLNGYQPRLVVKACLNDPTFLFECTTANGRASLNASSGIIYFTVSASDTLGFSPGMYEYQITITATTGVVYRLAMGRFQIMDCLGGEGCPN